jgi:DNA-binding transcriptional ArsR family regulator
MLRRNRKRPARGAQRKDPHLLTTADVGHHERVFAALGDGTRLALVSKLGSGGPYSISRLTSGSRLTRQAITKHLQVLERAGLVHSIRRGRENLFEFDPKPMMELKDYLETVSRQWDERLERLKKMLEK